MESTKVINLNEEGYQEVLMYQNQNPNRKYSISAIKYIKNGESTEYELLTDGEIKELKTTEKENYYNDKDKYIVRRRVIEVENASYVIIQRIYEKDVVNAIVFTKLEEIGKLKKIKQISKINNKNEKLLTYQKPYVRKITLK